MPKDCSHIKTKPRPEPEIPAGRIDQQHQLMNNASRLYLQRVIVDVGY